MENIKVFLQWISTDSGSFALLQQKSTNFDYTPMPTLALVLTAKIWNNPSDIKYF